MLKSWQYIKHNSISYIHIYGHNKNSGWFSTYIDIYIYNSNSMSFIKMFQFVSPPPSPLKGSFPLAPFDDNGVKTEVILWVMAVESKNTFKNAVYRNKLKTWSSGELNIGQHVGPQEKRHASGTTITKTM